MQSLRTWTLVLLLAVIGAVAYAGSDPQEIPQVKSKVDPYYPTILKGAGIEGDATVRVFVNEKGTVEKAEVLKASHEAFGASALDAVKQWSFTPAIRDGEPIKAELTIPIKFTLGKGAYKAQGEDLLELRKIVVELLEGKNPPEIQAHLGLEAYIALGDRYEHLPEVIGNPRKLALLSEGPKTTILFSRLQLFGDDNAGYLILRTKPNPHKPDRYHTIVIMKSESGIWKIAAWQAGAL